MKLNRSLLASPNFQKLILKCEDRQRAIGILAELYILAQDYFLPHKNPIPQAELIDADIPIDTLIRLGYLVKEVEGYYMRGSEQAFTKYFDDIEQRRKAGRASAESDKHHAVRGPDGRFIPKNEIAELQKTKKRSTAGRVKKKNVRTMSGQSKKKTKKKQTVKKNKRDGAVTKARSTRAKRKKGSTN